MGDRLATQNLNNPATVDPIPRKPKIHDAPNTASDTLFFLRFSDVGAAL